MQIKKFISSVHTLFYSTFVEYVQRLAEVKIVKNFVTKNEIFGQPKTDDCFINLLWLSKTAVLCDLNYSTT